MIILTNEKTQTRTRPCFKLRERHHSKEGGFVTFLPCGGVPLPPVRHDKRAMLHPDRAIWVVALQPAIPREEYTDTLHTVTVDQSHTYKMETRWGGGVNRSSCGALESCHTFDFWVKISLNCSWRYLNLPKLAQIKFWCQLQMQPLIDWNLKPK